MAHEYLAPTPEEIAVGAYHVWDIVILDMHMPWMDGHEVAAAFASDNTLSRVPIIFITHFPLDRNNSTDSIPILIKPFSIEDIFACFEKAFANPV